MSRVLYFDCFSGISGDMVLGALLDAGLPLEELKRALGSLALDGCRGRVPRRCCGRASRRRSSAYASCQRSALSVQTRTHGHDHHEHGHNHGHSHDHDPQAATVGTVPSARSTTTATLTAACRRSSPLIDRSALSAAGRERAKALFQRLAEAEAAIHQMPVEQVHLHEVGALDSIIDIVGAVFALEWAGVDRDRLFAAERRRRHGGLGARSFPGAGAGDAASCWRREAPIYSGA